MTANQVDVASIRFLTGSSYEGSWNNAVRTMDGFGSYRYPDGSVYRGRFVQGKFHGFGHLKLAQPYRLTIKGEFQRGKLVAIEDMWFNDGLHVQGSFQNDRFVCDKWDYLTPTDRRYQAERFYGQQPVGPTSYLTSNIPARKVPTNCFDIEEGIFNSGSGWLYDRQPPLSKSVYVSCPQEKKWITRNCRGERKDNVREPLPSFCRQIIKNNLETELSQLKDITIYAPDMEIHRESYFPKMCREKPAPDSQIVEPNPLFKRPPFQSTTNAERCLVAHQKREEKRADLHEKQWKASRLGGKMPPAERARIWASSSDPMDGDSGATHTMSKSPSELSLRTNVKDLYGTAIELLEKKATESLYVVQSNMKRPASFVDLSNSLFEL